MKVAISGGTGFVGKYLRETLFKQDEVVLLTREELAKNNSELAELMKDSDIVINLAGTPILGRWNDKYKTLLYSSRIDTTRKIADTLSLLEKKPSVFISTSAIGIYKKDSELDNFEFAHTEVENYFDNDFLADLCKDWENQAERVQNNEEIRTVIFRFGVVLGKNGGALSKMLTPFKLGLGGIIGDGQQHMSFIHIEDLKNAFKFAIENKDLHGSCNLVAPTPTTNYEMTKTLGKILKRPTIFPLPKFMVKTIFSEGSTVLIDGQKVLPEKLEKFGFKFKFKNIEEALRDILK